MCTRLSTDTSLPTESKAFAKAWEAKVKDELLSTRKDLLKGTLQYYRDLCKGASDVKEALKVCTCFSKD